MDMIQNSFAALMQAEETFSAIAVVLYCGFSIVMLLFQCLFVLVLIAGFVLWIIMLIDAIQREFDKENDKVLWIVILLFAGSIGALIYYIMIKRPADKIQ